MVEAAVIGRPDHQGCTLDVAATEAAGDVIDGPGITQLSELVGDPRGDHSDRGAGPADELDLARGDLAAADDEHAASLQVHEDRVVQHHRRCL